MLHLHHNSIDCHPSRFFWDRGCLLRDWNRSFLFLSNGPASTMPARDAYTETEARRGVVNRDAIAG